MNLIKYKTFNRKIFHLIIFNLYQHQLNCYFLQYKNKNYHYLQYKNKNYHFSQYKNYHNLIAMIYLRKLNRHLQQTLKIHFQEVWILRDMQIKIPFHFKYLILIGHLHYHSSWTMDLVQFIFLIICWVH